ncbi:MAG: NrtA/SsuA/CpmA family ABC transporter substrate-binding protein [Saprospiraceae bacterium]|nr:NrtA/SsuA/CpmA family ABC transporter substrate-binding protein [Saprospiraceae bacterium]
MNNINKKIGLAVGLFLSVALLVMCTSTNSSKKETTLSLGWQPPWANQGQIVEVFKNTDVLTRNKIKLDYKPFSYGGPMTEAALAGTLDILFVGDQPAITLVSRDPNWRFVARMVNYRSALIVPPNSKLKTINDLVGKKVATAFGSTTHRDVVRLIRDAGLEKDITLVNIDQAEHAALISKGGTDSWDGIDAVASYDPTIAISLYKNNARILLEWTSPAVVVARKEIVDNKPEELKRFLKAYIEANVIYAKNPANFNKLFSEESRLELPENVYTEMAKMEPNLTAGTNSEVNILIDSTRERIHQINADVALSIGIIKKQINVKDYIDMRAAMEASTETSK